MAAMYMLVPGVMLLSVLAVWEAAARRPDDDGADEAAIRQVIATYVATWNRNDIDAWGRLFTDDVDYVNRGGGWWKSNRENAEGHRVIHDALIRLKTRMGLQASVARISFLAPDIALVHAETSGPGVTPSGERKELRGVMTMVMLRRDGTWRIRALQNTLVDPPPLPGQPEPGR